MRLSYQSRVSSHTGHSGSTPSSAVHTLPVPSSVRDQVGVLNALRVMERSRAQVMQAIIQSYERSHNI